MHIMCYSKVYVTFTIHDECVLILMKGTDMRLLKVGVQSSC